MDHKHRANSYKRNGGRGKSVRHFILYVEGRNTEKSYFDLLKKSNCKVIPVTKRGHGISSCVEFVNDSDRAWKSLPPDERNKYCKRWLVFDYDGRLDFEDGVKLGRRKGFSIAFSSMCIEFWFLLHFQNQNGDPIPMIGDSHSAAQIQALNSHITKYNKSSSSPIALYDSSSKTVSDDLFDLMLATDPVTHEARIVSAFKRAKVMHERKKTRGEEFRESVTTMYQLLLELGVIVKVDDNDYDLYRK